MFPPFSPTLAEWFVVPDVQKIAEHQPPFDGLQWQQAIAAAASTWNEQANTRSFQVGPTSSEPGSDQIFHQLDSMCSSSHRGKVQVLFLDYYEDDDGENPNLCQNDLVGQDNRGALACAVPRCIGTDSRAKAATVIVFKRKVNIDGSIVTIQWNVGPAQSQQNNLIGTLTHELGHVSNLWHPNDDGSAPPSVMGSGQPGTLRDRDLWEWDMECAKECSQRWDGETHRVLTPRTRTINSAAPFFSAAETSSTRPAADASVSFVREPLTLQWSLAVSRSETNCSTGTQWGKGLSVKGKCVTNFVDQDAVGPVAALFREAPTSQYVFYSSFEDVLVPPHTNEWYTSRRISFTSSTDQFVSQSAGYFNVCNGMSGWMTCIDVANVLSLEAPSVTWLSGNVSAQDPSGVSVLAWVHNTRDDTGDDRDVKVAMRRLNNNTFPQPSNLEVQSNISPAVACALNYSGDYDCVVVYGPPSDPENDLLSQRFKVVAGIYGYAAQADPYGPYPVDNAGSYGARSANRPALIRVGSQFLLVVRSSRSNQPLEAWRSTDAMTWTYVSESLGYSTIPPQVQTSWPDVALTKTLLYAR